MGRAERRKYERNARIDDRKRKILMRPEDISKMKKDIAYEVSGFKTEALMTCFALALARQGFDADHIGECIVYINSLMDDILADRATMDDYIRELEDDTGIVVRCSDE